MDLASESGRILVMDDEEIVREICIELFDRNGAALY